MCMRVLTGLTAPAGVRGSPRSVLVLVLALVLDSSLTFQIIRVRALHSAFADHSGQSSAFCICALGSFSRSFGSELCILHLCIRAPGDRCSRWVLSAKNPRLIWAGLCCGGFTAGMVSPHHRVSSEPARRNAVCNPPRPSGAKFQRQSHSNDMLQHTNPSRPQSCRQAPRQSRAAE